MPPRLTMHRVARVVPVYPWLRQDITSSYDYHVTKGLKRRESSWTLLQNRAHVVT